ncbi:TPA: hypothetical protein HGT53_24980 [Escherichia coli]|uniref:Hypothetical ORF protein n=1 Tax=Escherichia coli TaxID=562 RepID=Q47331_ECOLX|nr:hypothetical protein BE966_17360 [Escherichia coli]EFJ94289.1 hypothetical protein HMPREF9531_00610 [Escherichia coli MS 45-1]EFU50653.1 hypothetical protein HMPREF9544_04271 [Escherichia coli MS 153-1]ESD97448.1 hypothetical protein HMPREF1614_03225 [Escherichia coli 908624]CAE55822.1 hypothetical protein [Escherichia coli Nissle 1917]
MNSVFPWGGSHIGISRILSCAAVNILPMVEMLGQTRRCCSLHGFKQTKICSSRLGSSILSRRISYRITRCHCFVRCTSGALLREIGASGP